MSSAKVRSGEVTRARGGDATAETRAKDVDDDPSTAARDGRGWTLARAIRVVAVTCVVALALDRRAPARGGAGGIEAFEESRARAK